MDERKGFGTNFGFLMAAVGSAVGLGNIWGFPYKMGANGGFAYLAAYLVLAAVCGFVVLLAELALGRKTGAGAVKAYRLVSKKLKWVGWLGVASAFLILSFYCALGGYCLKYLVLNLGNVLHSGFGTNGMSGGEVFNAFVGNMGESTLYGMIFVAITMLIVMGGISDGIERVCSVGMPVLFILLVISIIRAVTLPGAVDGLKYMFIPGWAVANGVIEEAPSIFSVISAAGGQMFFSLSIGMAIMITYGSYLDKKENLEKNALVIVVMDTLIAILAGLCVIPARFALDPDGPLGGPGLLFITMQNVFDRMGPIGPIFGLLFYLLVIFAAISSSISLLEAVVVHFVDDARDRGLGDKRKKYTLIIAVLVAVLCVLVCVDGLGSNHIAPADLLHLTVKGWNDCWLDFFDMLSEGVMMPLGGLLLVLMLGFETGTDLIRDECEATPGHRMRIYTFFKICVRVLTPIVMLIVLYGQIRAFFW